MTEKTSTNINVEQTAEKVIDTVSQMDLHSLIHQWIIPYGTKIVLAILIYVLGKRLAKILSKFIGKAALASSGNQMIQSFVTSISYFLGLLIVVIASLSQLGINTSSLVALIGAAGLAIGLALQNSLQNFAAGVMLLIFTPFKKGETITSNGFTGTVQQMGLLMLELRTGDNQTVLLPNSSVFSNPIINTSCNPTRRVDLIFDIAPHADVAKAKAVIEQIIKAEPKILLEPAATVNVGALNANAVQLFVRPWVKTEDYSTVSFDVTEKVKLAFDKAGIATPVSQKPA